MRQPVLDLDLFYSIQQVFGRATNDCYLGAFQAYTPVGFTAEKGYAADLLGIGVCFEIQRNDGDGVIVISTRREAPAHTLGQLERKGGQFYDRDALVVDGRELKGEILRPRAHLDFGDDPGITELYEQRAVLEFYRRRAKSLSVFLDCHEMGSIGRIKVVLPASRIEKGRVDRKSVV